MLKLLGGSCSVMWAPGISKTTAVASKKTWHGDAALLGSVLNALPLDDSGKVEVEYSIKSRPHRKRLVALTSVLEGHYGMSPRTTVRQSTIRDSLRRMHKKTYEAHAKNIGMTKQVPKES